MADTPTTQAADSDGPSAKVNLWPTAPQPDFAGGESVSNRGKGGTHDRHISHISNPRVEVFLPKNPDPNRPACIIIPGGGYGLLAFDIEGYQEARYLNAHGVAAFVLIHRMPNGQLPEGDREPAPMQDVHRALRVVRANSDKWNIDPHRLGILGFSAGGHLASTAATQFDAGHADSADPIERQSDRPDFAVLMYPVITLIGPAAHMGSRENLLGKEPPESWIHKYSAQEHVTDQTPPLLIMHAEDDGGVPPENSLLMAQAAIKAHVPCELVLFKRGGHGFGMGKPGSETGSWPQRCVDWMKVMKIINPAASAAAPQL